MRVLEHGLRALAARLKVRFELEDWRRIIGQIESALKEIDQEPKTPEKKDRQQFYSEVAAQFHYFKNAWGNHAMHAQAHYGEDDARRILEHVSAFMQHLAARLSEDQANL